MEQKTIVVVGTFDTKGQEYLFVRDLISRNKYKVITIDVGTGARGELVFPPEYPREEVVKAADSSMEEILSLGEEGQEVRIMEIMARGATKICQRLHQSGRLNGIISLGGTMGTNLGTTVMRSLPFGVPKVMLSTVASADTRPFVSTSDIVMIPSIADIAGLNQITETMLTRAAGAVMGMVGTGELKVSGRPLIGITNIGGTIKCATHVKKRLEEKGYEVVIFHANGIGGKAMEELIEQGVIKVVFDLSPNEVVDHLYGGWGDAGSTRLEAAGRKGIPKLIGLANTDHLVYPSRDKIPERFRNHHVHPHGPSIFSLRTKKREMEEVAEVIAEKLNRASGPTAVILPLKGLSFLDLVDEGFVDQEANFALFETLKRNLKPEIEVREVNAHVNDDLFAEEAVEMLYKLMSGKERRRPKSK